MKPLAPRWRNQLGIRLALAIVTVVLAFAAVGGTVLVRHQERLLRDQSRQRAAALLRTLAVPAAMSVAEYALERLDGYLAEVVRSGDELQVLYVAMLDTDGRVATWSTGLVENLPIHQRNVKPSQTFLLKAQASRVPVWEERVDAAGRPVLWLSMPAVSGLRWGTLVAVFDLSRLQAALVANQQLWMVSALLLALALGAVAWLGLLLLVVLPIRRLDRTARQLESGQRDARANLRRNDEIGRFAKVFDALAASAARSIEELEQAVAERSAEIQRKNEELLEVNGRLAGANEELDRLAHVDPLTAVPNRRSFGQLMARTVTQPDAAVLLLLDIDHFKRLNDDHGHLLGDAVLRSFAAVLGQNLRQGDVLARYGGEEFAVVLPGASAQYGLEVAERLRNAVAEHDFATELETPLPSVTLSAGLACYPDDASSVQGLIDCADQALYAAKAAGRNQVWTWQQLQLPSR